MSTTACPYKPLEEPEAGNAYLDQETSVWGGGWDVPHHGCSAARVHVQLPSDGPRVGVRAATVTGIPGFSFRASQRLDDEREISLQALYPGHFYKHTAFNRSAAFPLRD